MDKYERKPKKAFNKTQMPFEEFYKQTEQKINRCYKCAFCDYLYIKRQDGLDEGLDYGMCQKFNHPVKKDHLCEFYKKYNDGLTDK